MEVRGARGSNDLREKHLVAQSGEILGAEGRVWSEKRELGKNQRKNPRSPEGGNAGKAPWPSPGQRATGGRTHSGWCGRRPAAASRSSPRAAGSAPRGPAAGWPSRSWPRTGLAPARAPSWRGPGPSRRRRRPEKPRSRDGARGRAGSRAGAHPRRPETSSGLRVWAGDDSEETRRRNFRRRGGTSGPAAEVGGAVPWPRILSAGRIRIRGLSAGRGLGVDQAKGFGLFVCFPRWLPSSASEAAPGWGLSAPGPTLQGNLGTADWGARRAVD